MCLGLVVFAGEKSLRSNYTLSQLLEEIEYTLDDEMLEEFVTTIKGE